MSKMALTSADLNQQRKELEDQELTELNYASKINVYSKTLALHMLQNDLIRAKLLLEKSLILFNLYLHVLKCYR